MSIATLFLFMELDNNYFMPLQSKTKCIQARLSCYRSVFLLQSSADRSCLSKYVGIIQYCQDEEDNRTDTP